MKAAWYEEYGPAEQVLRVGELPKPEPGSGEVLVRVHASGVNPSDCNRRLGIRDRPGYPRIVPHSDGAGVIEALGAGVADRRVGDRVWIHSAQRARAMGTAAEYVTLPVDLTVPLADNVSFEEGACLGVPAITAYYSLFADGPLEGLDVLVTGGAGACGHYAVQFAKFAGAGRVLATVSTPEKAAHATAAGADRVINYRTEDVAERVLEATAGAGVARISEVDFGGNLAATLKVIQPSGVIGAYASKGDEEPRLPFYPFLFKDVTLRMIQAWLMPERLRVEANAAIDRLCADGRLQHTVARVLPLDEIVEAHRLVERLAVMGNVILQI